MNIDDFTQYKETRLHEQPGFAYNTYLCTIPLDFPSVQLHWHDQMEIIYIKKGSGIVSVNLLPYPVSAGSIVPVLPGELHAIVGNPAGPMEYENIIFSLSILDSQEDHDWVHEHVILPLSRGQMTFPRPLVPGTEFHRDVAAALDAADAACEYREAGFSLIVKSQLFLMLHAFFRYRSDDPDNIISSPHAAVIKQVLDWTREHYREEITVEMAAQVSGYSPSHFMRIFKEETGQTFVHFLLDYRLAAAAYELSETGVPVGDIAGNCGFDNFSYFTRAFKKRYGMTPRSYRNKNAQG